MNSLYPRLAFLLKFSFKFYIFSKWIKSKVKIKHASKSTHRLTFKLRPSVKYTGIYAVLLEQFKTARAMGSCVNFGWLWSKARKIYKAPVSYTHLTLPTKA